MKVKVVKNLFFFQKNFAAGRSAISSPLRSLSNHHFCTHHHHHHSIAMSIKFVPLLLNQPFLPCQTYPAHSEHWGEQIGENFLKQLTPNKTSPSTVGCLGHLVKISARPKIFGLSHGKNSARGGRGYPLFPLTFSVNFLASRFP